MANPNAITDLGLMDNLDDLSLYEDALDESDEDLRHLHRDTVIQIEKVTNRARQKVPLSCLPNLPGHSAAPPVTQRSSSSEHSSIERINPDSFRSRRSTGIMKRRSHKSGNSSASNGNGGETTPEEWKLVNYAFQEAAAYPVLFQLNQQLQTINTQLNELACANALQLKATYRLLQETIKMNRHYRQRTPLWVQAIFVWIPLMSVPFLLRLLYHFYQSKKHYISHVLLKYM